MTSTIPYFLFDTAKRSPSSSRKFDSIFLKVGFFNKNKCQMTLAREEATPTDPFPLGLNN